MPAENESDVTPRPATEVLEHAVQDPAVLEAMGSEPMDLYDVWKSLTEGESRIVRTFHSEHRCYMVLVQDKSAEQKPCFFARNVRILQLLLLGHGQKAVAMDLDLSPSTITTAAKQCLTLMGMSSWPSRVPILLVMAAFAGQRGRGALTGRTTSIPLAERAPVHGKSYRVISAQLPRALLAGRLSPAESDVLRLLIEGKSHSQIARRRKRSMRTVANQLASCFQRFGVSGRSELLSYLVTMPAKTALEMRDGA